MAGGRDKYLSVVERLSRRIERGDYHTHGVPAERLLAQEVGVSYATLRKSIQVLIDAGLLIRQANGRLAVAAGADETTRRQVALLAPAWESGEVALFNAALAQLRKRYNFASRVVHFVHWDDPTILNTLRQFDATFLLPPEEPTEAHASELLSVGKPLVVLNGDWSPWGVRSLRMFPPVLIQRLLDHLASLGHRKIVCFNVQPKGSVIHHWLRQWELWCAANEMPGVLIDEPVAPHTDTLSAAYDIMDRYVREHRGEFTAMLCLTETAAMGASRAMLDQGIRLGHDVALCTVGSNRCEYLPLTFTTLEQTDPKPYLATCLEWALGGQTAKWHGPLLMQPTDVQVVPRQSTVPDIDTKQPPPRARNRKVPAGETP